MKNIIIGLCVCFLFSGCIGPEKSVRKEETIKIEKTQEKTQTYKTRELEKKESKSQEEWETTMLDVPLYIQENNYYCGPASLQMVLKYHGIDSTQSQLAQELKTSSVTGTEYADMANIANKYIFGNEHVAANAPGYHVQALSSNDSVYEVQEQFRRRAMTDFSTNDPFFVAVNLKAIYPEMNTANHFLVVTGYKKDPETSQIYYSFIESYGPTKNKKYEGIHWILEEDLIQAILTNEEPAYIF